MIKSGPTFTIIATLENEIYFWGTKYKVPSVQENACSAALTPSSAFRTTIKEMLTTSIVDDHPSELIAEPKEILS